MNKLLLVMTIATTLLTTANASGNECTPEAQERLVRSQRIMQAASAEIMEAASKNDQVAVDIAKNKFVKAHEIANVNPCAN